MEHVIHVPSFLCLNTGTYDIYTNTSLYFWLFELFFESFVVCIVFLIICVAGASFHAEGGGVHDRLITPLDTHSLKLAPQN